MAINVETIELDEGESFRVLRWNRAVEDVGLLGNQGGVVPLRGSGNLWHLHEEIELTFVSEGSGTRCVGNQVSSFEIPSLVLLGSNLPHYWRFSGRSSGLCVQVNVPRLAMALPRSVRRELHGLSRRAEKGLLFLGKVLAQAIVRIEELVASRGLARMGILLRLLGELGSARGASAKELSTKRFDVSRVAPGYEPIQKAILLILTSFREHLTLEQVLATTHMSKAHFSRRFVAYTGKTYIQFLNDVRIDYACRRLAETGESVMDIAFACGFNNLSHFNRMFRRYQGMSPTEYRLESA